MPRYTVLVSETRHKEYILKAPDEESAKRWAQDNVSFDMYDPSEDNDLVSEFEVLVTKIPS